MCVPIDYLKYKMKYKGGKPNCITPKEHYSFHCEAHSGTITSGLWTESIG